MKNWLRKQRAPAQVERALEAAARGLNTEVDACDECGRSQFVSSMVDLSTQERGLLLCRSCFDYRQRLRSMEGRHRPTQQYSCLCGYPTDSPIHIQSQEQEAHL